MTHSCSVSVKIKGRVFKYTGRGTICPHFTPQVWADLGPAWQQIACLQQRVLERIRFARVPHPYDWRPPSQRTENQTPSRDPRINIMYLFFCFSCVTREGEFFWTSPHSPVRLPECLKPWWQHFGNAFCPVFHILIGRMLCSWAACHAYLLIHSQELLIWRTGEKHQHCFINRCCLETCWLLSWKWTSPHKLGLVFHSVSTLVC